MGAPFIRADWVLRIATAICAFWLTSAFGQEAAKHPQPNAELERCRRVNNELMRTRCLEEIKAKAAAVPQQQAPATASWQLARTANPSGGPDSISITKIINPTPSEQDVTGLMLRCAEGATTNVLIVLAAPLPPRSHPKVTVVTRATTSEFIASVVPPGALILLPEKASALLETTWQSVPELTLSITESKHSLQGVVPLDDIGAAMQTLQSNCPTTIHSRK